MVVIVFLYRQELKLFKSFRPDTQACFLPSTTISALYAYRFEIFL